MSNVGGRWRCAVVEERPVVRRAVLAALARDGSLQVTNARSHEDVAPGTHLVVSSRPWRGDARALSLEGCDISDHARVLDLVHTALRGGPEATGAGAAPVPVALSAHERAVLDCVASGMTAAEAGLHLGVSRRSVESAKRRVFDKLGARSQADAVRLDHDARSAG